MRYRQFEPLIVSDFEVQTWDHPIHNHNHHELIYIKHGSGSHVINQVLQPYNEGNVFLLGPDQEHSFIINETTRFIFIKFTDSYIYQRDGILNAHIRALEYLIKSQETHFRRFKLIEQDQATASLIFDVIISLNSKTALDEHLVWLQVLALATLLQRNMPEIKQVAGRNKDLQAMFCYLHKNIYSPSQLKASAMAAHFNSSANYIGPYFKRNTGMTLRDYISSYRKSLIKERLKSGNYSQKQIALEFGLTDESHVYKLLQKE